MAAEAPGASDILRGRCILVIDDDLDILDGMRRVLEDWGCDVILAASGADALESIEHGRRIPDAILADYGLAEGHTGVQAIAAIEQHVGRPVPALVISALEPDDLGDHSLITKPAHPAELKLRLANLVDG